MCDPCAMMIIGDKFITNMQNTQQTEVDEEIKQTNMFVCLHTRYAVALERAHPHNRKCVCVCVHYVQLIIDNNQMKPTSLC